LTAPAGSAAASSERTMKAFFTSDSFPYRLLVSCYRYNPYNHYKTGARPLSSRNWSVILVVAIMTSKPVLNFVIEAELLKHIDDFRFRYRFPTRASAIKWLLQAALTAKLAPKL